MLLVKIIFLSTVDTYRKFFIFDYCDLENNKNFPNYLFALQGQYMACVNSIKNYCKDNCTQYANA